MSEPKKVLLVEDSILAQRIMSGILKEICNVTCVDTTLAAQKEMAGSSFDLIIADLMLKESTTWGLFQQIRKNATPTQLPIIVITTSLDQRTFNRLLLAGVNDAFEKPVPPSLLKAVVTKMLNACYVRSQPEGSSIAVECISWESNDEFFIYSPDIQMTVSGSTKEEALQKMITFLRQNIASKPQTSLVHNVQKTEILISFAKRD